MVQRKGSIVDSRIKSVSITPEFATECEQIEKDLRIKMRASIYADITPADLRIYIKVLYQLSNMQLP